MPCRAGSISNISAIRIESNSSTVHQDCMPRSVHHLHQSEYILRLFASPRRINHNAMSIIAYSRRTNVRRYAGLLRLREVTMERGRRGRYAVLRWRRRVSTDESWPSSNTTGVRCTRESVIELFLLSIEHSFKRCRWTMSDRLSGDSAADRRLSRVDWGGVYYRLTPMING